MKDHRQNSTSLEMETHINVYQQQQMVFFQPDKNLLDLVKKGEILGKIKSLSGELLEEIFLPIQGFVGMLRMLPSPHVGHSLFMIVNGFKL